MEKERSFVECECGYRVYGRSEKHAKSLLPEHKKSKRHKELMEIKERREQNEK